MQNDLKHCPLCGHTANIEEAELNLDNNRIKIVCSGCGLELDHTQEFMIHEVKDPITGMVIKVTRVAINESAIDLWNRRINND